MAFIIDIQHAISTKLPVTDDELKHWTNLALNSQMNEAELTLRVVSLEEISQLNVQYRKKQGPTNVLSFPTQVPKALLHELQYPLLGDIIICADVLFNESHELHKPLKHHWAHIVIHGVLHLMGHDHMKPEEEAIMQAIEIKLLNEIGIPNPYEDHE